MAPGKPGAILPDTLAEALRLFRLPATLSVLTLLPGLAWPAADAAAKRLASADSLHHIARARPGANDAVERVFPEDAFRKFLLESRRFEDSLHYQRGEQAFGQEEFAVALGRHLAADLPATGAFRNDLLAQRSRIFARIWPSSIAPGRADSRELHAREGSENVSEDDSENDSRKTSFDWEAGTGHSGERYRSGPLFPFGMEGFQSDSRYWSYNANARLGRTIFLGMHGLHLALSANASRSSAMGPSDYAAAMDMAMTNGILENLYLSLTTGLSGSQAGGSYRYNGVAVSKAWNFESVGAYLEAGYSRQWDLGWGRMSDNAWTRLSREFQPETGNGVTVSLAASLTGMKSNAYRYRVPVLFVDDIGHANPSHFQGPDFGDPVALDNLISSLRSDPQPREISLNLDAPQAYFSLSPSVSYGLPPIAGWHARAGATYGLDIYPDYVWDRVTWPDDLEPYSWDLLGLALNRADGRYYTAVVIEEEGVYHEYYGTTPLERRKTRRVDNRAGVNINLARQLPHGYFLGVASSVSLAWSNLPKTAPATLRPWQWGLTFSMSRSSLW
jgi:hypothetical protein